MNNWTRCKERRISGSIWSGRCSWAI